MLVNDLHLKPSYSQTSIRNHLLNNKLTNSIGLSLFLVTILAFPAAATNTLPNANKNHNEISSLEDAKEIPLVCNRLARNNKNQTNYRNNCQFKQPKSVAQAKQTETLDSDRFLLSSRTKYYSGAKISSGQMRLMIGELERLIGRFETTLFTADALQSDTDLSTVEVVRQILKQPTITSKQNIKRTNKSPYRDAHKALYRARQGAIRFQSLIEQRYYAMARAEWLASKKALWDNYPIDRSVAQSEVRAMWLDRGTIVKARSPEDLVPIFDRMAQAGINTVFFETVNSGYTIHPSKVAPQQNPLVKGWDPLQAAIELAHERGIELHAWVWTFAAVNQRHNIILDLPRNYLGPVLSKHPDWAMTDHEGSRFHYSSRKVFFDPAHAEVQNYLSSLITEIATDYDVDGIHLDYIRYPFQSPTGKMTYGYGAASRDLFRKQTGFDPIHLYPEHPLWSEWTKFRIEQIDNFVAATADNLRQLRPDLILSTAVFPMPKRERLLKIQQHWETWVDREWIDLLVPMTYAKDADTLYTLANPLLNEFTRGKALLLPGIRLLDILEVNAIDQMQLLRGMSTEGYSLFAAENLNSNLIDIFQTTQGSVTAEHKQLIPYRKPFQTSLTRYRDLQKEWNYFLINNQQELSVATLEKWAEKADRLAQELQKLAEEPSHKNLFSTQIALKSLRRQFPKWIEEAQTVDLYQGQVWQNRLDTVDRLLSYGEKKVLNRKPVTPIK